MFSEVFVLMKIMLLCPTSSSECERSFSTLRRLKSWLRSTATQKGLNHVAVCHTHKEELDSMDMKKLAEEFIQSQINSQTVSFWQIMNVRSEFTNLVNWLCP